MRPGFAALAVAAGLLFGGCSAPPQPIAAEVALELQSEVEGIAVLTARGDTADAVAAAHALAAKVRTAQTEGQITGERAIMILDRVEQLIERLVRSGAAPAPGDVPQPLTGPAAPEVAPSPEPEPSETDEPTEDPEPTETGEPSKAAEPAETSGPVVPEPTDTAAGDLSGSGSAGDPRSSGPDVPVPVIIDEVDNDEVDNDEVDIDDDDDGGKGRGRGRSSDD